MVWSYCPDSVPSPKRLGQRPLLWKDTSSEQRGRPRRAKRLGAESGRSASSTCCGRAHSCLLPLSMYALTCFVFYFVSFYAGTAIKERLSSAFQGAPEDNGHVSRPGTLHEGGATQTCENATHSAHLGGPLGFPRVIPMKIIDPTVS